MSYGPDELLSDNEKLENLPTSCWVVTKNFRPGEIILPQIPQIYTDFFYLTDFSLMKVPKSCCIYPEFAN